MPGSEVRGNIASFFATVLRFSFLGMWEVGWIFRSEFQNWHFVGGKNYKGVCRGLCFFVVYPFSSSCYSFLSVVFCQDSAFTFCYTVTLSFVSPGFLPWCSGESLRRPFLALASVSFLPLWEQGFLKGSVWSSGRGCSPHLNLENPNKGAPSVAWLFWLSWTRWGERRVSRGGLELRTDT